MSSLSPDPDFVTPPTTGAIARRPSAALPTTVVTNALVSVAAAVPVPPLMINLYKLGTTLRKDDVVYDIINPQKGLLELGGYKKIKLDLLRGFCKGNSISGYSGIKNWK